MANAAEQARAIRRRRGHRANRPYLEIAAGLTALWVQGASAQSDPAFSATPSQGNPQGTAGGTAANGGPADPAAAGGGFVVRIPSQLRAFSPLQPFTGSTAQSNGLRDNAASSLSPPLDRAARSWSITPSLGVAEEYSSSVLASAGSGQGSDFITLVQPGLSASGSTTRLQGSISYNPEIDIYARNFKQSHVNQNFGGNVLAVLLPGTVFLDLRAYGGVTTNGAGGNSGTSTASTSLQTQSLAFSASPYAVQRFGDLGTAEIGATLSRSSSTGGNGSNTFNGVNGNNGFNGFNNLNNPNGFNGVNNQGFTTNPYFSSGNQTATTYGAHAGFQTGEAFDRYNGTAIASLSQTQGSGVLSNSARDIISLDNGYGVTRLFTLLARVGYEHIRYGGTRPVHIDDAILTGGFRLTLGPTSTVQATYGHQEGFNSFGLTANVQPTARTRVNVSYSEGLDTDAEQLQNGLASADFDQLGNPVDHTSGAPLLLGTTGLFGAQNSVFKTRRLSATGTLLQAVDVFSLSINAEDNQLVSSSGLPNQLGTNQGVFGSLNWSHEVSPTLSLNSFAQYGVRSAKQSGTQHIITGSTALVKSLSETLSAQLRYTYNRNTGGQGFGIPGSGIQATLANGQPLSNYEQSVILLSAVKSF